MNSHFGNTKLRHWLKDSGQVWSAVGKWIFNDLYWQFSVTADQSRAGIGLRKRWKHACLPRQPADKKYNRPKIPANCYIDRKQAVIYEKTVFCNGPNDILCFSFPFILFSAARIGKWRPLCWSRTGTFSRGGT